MQIPARLGYSSDTGRSKKEGRSLNMVLESGMFAECPGETEVMVSHTRCASLNIRTT